MRLNDTLKALDILGPKLVQIYGQGESPMTITGLPKRLINDITHPNHIGRCFRRDSSDRRRCLRCR